MLYTKQSHGMPATGESWELVLKELVDFLGKFLVKSYNNKPFHGFRRQIRYLLSY
jgi:hypothetical protein